jgi:hypothetical protein
MLINPQDRKWEWLPALSKVLASKRVPEHYYGPSSVSDNMFGQVVRLMELTILLRENQSEMVEGLDGKPQEGVLKDLLKVREALRMTERHFGAMAEDVDDIVNRLGAQR